MCAAVVARNQSFGGLNGLSIEGEVTLTNLAQRPIHGLLDAVAVIMGAGLKKGQECCKHLVVEARGLEDKQSENRLARTFCEVLTATGPA